MSTVPGVFVTGTDTGIGKTFVASALLLAARQNLLKAYGMKPVASGSSAASGEWRNSDAEQLRQYSTTPHPDYTLINPFALPEPIAPHLAARHAGREVELPPIRAAYSALCHGAGAMVVEGVGGWAVPLSGSLMQKDLVRALKLPVLLVVGIRLGCINHAILTERAVFADGFVVKGWIANRIDPDCLAAPEVIASLQDELGAPMLAEIAHGISVERAADQLRSAARTLFTAT